MSFWMRLLLHLLTAPLTDHLIQRCFILRFHTVYSLKERVYVLFLNLLFAIMTQISFIHTIIFVFFYCQIIVLVIATQYY